MSSAPENGLVQRHDGLDPTLSRAPGEPSCGSATSSIASAPARTPKRPSRSPSPGTLRISLGRDDRVERPCAGPPPQQDRSRTGHATPRMRTRSQSGATTCAQPTCGSNPRTSAWRKPHPRPPGVWVNPSPAITTTPTLNDPRPLRHTVHSQPHAPPARPKPKSTQALDRPSTSTRELW
jgi:hypothetical protein